MVLFARFMTSESNSLKVVVIVGNSPHALHQIIADLPEAPGFATIVVGGEVRGPVRIPIISVENSTALESDRLYTLPDRDVALVDGTLIVDHDHRRAPIDTLLRSVAEHIGAGTTAVILADGTGDGTLGIKRVKEAGGLTIAQRPELGAVPSSAAMDLVDLVLPVDRIAPELVAHATTPPFVIPEPDEPAHTEPDPLRDILTLVRVRSGHDFLPYKRATLYRRIARRIQVCGCNTLADYHVFLREHPNELGSLLRDFVIGVTNFFRDPDAFAVLETDVIPRLFANKSATDHVRVWIAGCATGEEAYSIGILLLEHAHTLRNPPQIQLFATDIDEYALAEARQGLYPAAIAVDVSQERLERFFTFENNQYRVNKELRALVLFSPHNILRDPPFSRLDLVSCRNLLIYLGREAQNRVLGVFHFSLRPEGFLFLGSSESAENMALFGAYDAKARMFQRRVAPASLDTIGSTARWQPPAHRQLPVVIDRSPPAGELHYRVVEEYAPPSLLVDAELDVVHLSEHAGSFLHVSPGEPTRQLFSLVTPGLRLDLRSAVYAARQNIDDRRVVTFDDDGKHRTVELRVRRVDIPELGAGSLLIMFEELPPNGQPPPPQRELIEPVVREIEDELHRTRDQLRTTVEQYETSLEELKASNEELQAINEELRSATEELETSKEELQSVNEELTTLNHELEIKIDEISHANSDLQNLMSSTDIAVLFLDRNLNIKRFTPRVRELFNVIPSDIGRPLAHVTHRIEAEDLSATAETVLQSLRTVEREVESRDGRRYLARWLPYRSVEDHIDGVVLTFVDITDLRDAVAAQARAQAALVQIEERLYIALRAAPIAILYFDAEMQTTWAYFNGQEISDGDLPIFAPGHTQHLRQLVEMVMHDRSGQRTEIDVVLDGSRRTFDFRIEPTPLGVTAIGFDITPSKEAEASLRESDRRKDDFLATLAHELRNPLAPLRVALDVARLVDSDASQRAHSLTIMDRQVTMLSQLVDELLDLSRITQNKVELRKTTVELADIIERALESTKPLFEAAQHDLQVDIPERSINVYGDRSRLVQVFTNLLSNAAKFTPPKGHVSLDVKPRPDGRVVVTVTDDGIGLAPEHLANIFEIFVQCRDEHGRAQGGLGIGLNVVRRLVELHGGSVAAASDGLGRGSKFSVELPIGKE